MTSILTNVSAMAALQTLRGISSSMEDTQAHISSGLAVGSAKDNAAYWSIATTMRSDDGALSAVQDALGLGSAKIDTAYAGMNAAIDVVKQIQQKLVAAKEPGVDKTKIQEEVTQLQDQLKSISESASFSGENWLQGNATTTTTKSVVGSFVRDSTGAVSVKTIDYELSDKTLLFDTSAGAVKQGILDNTDVLTAANNVAVKVNVGGVETNYNVRAYSIDDLIAAGAKFAGNLASVGSVGATNAATNGYYVKVTDDTWVKVGTHTNSVGYVGLEAISSQTAANAANTTAGSIYYFVATGNVAATTAVTFSVADLDVTTDNLDDALSVVNRALGQMTSSASILGAASARLDLQEDFMSKLRDAISSGVGRLVDADMNEESTRLKALQTQQQLAIQALSIANSDSQNILSLFR
jgi:flagellin